MKALLVFCVFCNLSLALLGQPITFFESNHNDFGAHKLHHSFIHEFGNGGYIHGYDLNYFIYSLFAYEYFDAHGQFVKQFQPTIQYDNPQIGYTNTFKNKQVFVSGVGETDSGNKRFSYCFDSTGAVTWSFHDSLFILIILEETDTNYFAQLYSSKDTGMLSRGNNIVRINRTGEIYMSVPFSDLYNQLASDSITTTLIMDMQLYNGKLIFHLMNKSSFEHNKVVYFDGNFKLKGEEYGKYINSIFPNKEGILYDYQLGIPNYNRYGIKSIDWGFSKNWVLEADTGILSTILNGGFKSIGSNWCFASLVTDSTWVNWLDYYLPIYNYKGEKVRECRYKYRKGLQYGLKATTADKGLLMHASPEEWFSRQSGMLKTDSLGLVYNTDVICNCTDFKTEDTTGVETPYLPELNVQVFPNPAEDKINVLLSHQQKATINLRNLNGQIVLTQEAEYNSNIMDICGLTNGVYVVEVVAESARSITKLVVE